MHLNDSRDSFYTDKGAALRERKRILMRGGKAHVRSYLHPKRGKLVRLRVQVQPS